MRRIDRIKLSWQFIWFGYKRKYIPLKMNMLDLTPDHKWCDRCGNREARWDHDGGRVCNTCDDILLQLD